MTTDLSKYDANQLPNADVLGRQRYYRLFTVVAGAFGDVADIDQRAGIEEGVGFQQFLLRRVGKGQFVDVGIVHIQRFAVVGRFNAEHGQQEALAAQGDSARIVHRGIDLFADRNGEIRLQRPRLQVGEETR